MRFVLILFILIITANSVFSQKEFRMNSMYGDSTLIQVNGKRYFITRTESKIPTRYPQLDTLTFLSDAPGSQEKILCNFKPDSSYTISMACCGSQDIIPSSKLKNDSLSIWDFEEDFDKIQNQLMDRPFISIRTTKKTKDSIYAWHADAACLTEHQVITKELWKLGVPPKCFYWNNITSIKFFKTDRSLPKHEETDMEEFLSIKNIVQLNSISFRLFDNERFIITYDEKKNKVNLEYE